MVDSRDGRSRAAGETGESREGDYEEADPSHVRFISL
jgi:hypothetical protein